MKKIDFAPPISEAFEIDGNKVQVVSIPLIELKNIYANEQMLARRIAKKQLEKDKEDLTAEPFDAQVWAELWCSQNGITCEDGRFSTEYAKHNNGKKPPQNYYEVRLNEITNENLGLAILHFFIRDEKCEMYFDPQTDYINTAYSIERAVLTEWLLKNEDLKVACNFAASGNLMGFTRETTKQKEKSEKKEV